MGQISLFLLPEKVYVEPFHERGELSREILQGFGTLFEYIQ